MIEKIIYIKNIINAYEYIMEVKNHNSDDKKRIVYRDSFEEKIKNSSISPEVLKKIDVNDKYYKDIIIDNLDKNSISILTYSQYGYNSKVTYNNNIIKAIKYTIGYKSFAVASTLHCDGNEEGVLTPIPGVEINANLQLSGLKYDKLPRIKLPTEFFIYINDVYKEGSSYYVDIFVPDKSRKVYNPDTKNEELKSIKDIKISNISKASAMISLSPWNYIDPFSGIADEKNSNPKLPLFEGVDTKTIPTLLNNNKNLYSLFVNSITSMSEYGVSNPIVAGTFADSSVTFCGSSIIKDKFAKGSFMVFIIGIQYNPYTEDDFIGDKLKDSYMSYITNFNPSSSRYDGGLSQIADMFGISINYRPIGGKTDVFEAWE